MGMDRSAKGLGEIQTVGMHTREWIVDSRVCPLLQIHGIGGVGISEASRGFRFVRAMPKMSVLMTSLEGRGRAYVNGKYECFTPGMAYLMPPRVLHAYEAAGHGVWRICWVYYHQTTDHTPIIPTDKPRLVRAAPEPLEEAIRGLHRETSGHSGAPIQKLYVELIHEHSARIIGRNPPLDDRLWKLWTLVETDLAHGWTLEALARSAGLSIESLRVLSKQSTGRSPMKHLTFLRMQQASSALASANVKISVIAEGAGYSDAFAFSVAFKRHIGMSPSAYRERSKSVSIH